MLGYRPYHLYEVIGGGVTQMSILEEAVKAKYNGVGKPYGKPEFDKWLADYDVNQTSPTRGPRRLTTTDEKYRQ